MTRPFFTVREYAPVTRPTVQFARMRARLACVSSLPLSCGTLQVRAKVALADRFALIVSVHVLVFPEQLPLQPEKREPAFGLAVNVTELPRAKAAEQLAPQLMPAGLDVTVPEPRPAFVTASVRVWSANVAVTERSALMVTVHVPVPEQAPLQPAKVEPASALALNVTELPSANPAEQLAPQLIPAGEDVTVPAPAPAFVTESVRAGRANVAVTV
jgi:hypothetical protein